MRSIDLSKLVSVMEEFSSNKLRNKYLFHLHQSNENGSLKDEEWACLKQLLEEISKVDLEINLGGFFLSYTIPQISKEFDMLKIGTKKVLNIELKSRTTGKERRQLLRNRYYLSHLGLDIHSFVYISSVNELYKIEKDELVLSSVSELVASIQDIVTQEELLIDELFDVADYLVSPIRTPERFLNEEYFLTSLQEYIKKEIISSLDKGDTLIHFISSEAGTGKTLLMYDLAKSLQISGKVCIIHCGLEVNGHMKVSDAFENIDIISSSKIEELELLQYKNIIIDEGHRIDLSLITQIMNKVKVNNTGLIVSMDRYQTLTTKDEQNDVYTAIINTGEVREYSLHGKIRTNSQMSSFIRSLFNLAKQNPNMIYDDVELLYAGSYEEAKLLFEHYYMKGYVVLNHTPSVNQEDAYKECEMYKFSHDVIGQEFDNVLVQLNDYFSYDDGILVSKQVPESEYVFTKLLYQEVTRVRKKLCLVIINNEELFEKILEILV